MSEPEGVEVFYTPKCGWASVFLGWTNGIGPYFSLPEALRRAEAEIGEMVWRPGMTKFGAFAVRAEIIPTPREEK